MKHRLTLVLSAALLLAACATPPQAPIALSGKVFAVPSSKVGVLIATMPKVDTEFPGAACLLCLAAASIANSELTNYTQTLPFQDFTSIDQQVAEIIKKKGANATIVTPIELKSLPDSSKGPNFARKDFSSLKAQYKLDKLLVISVNTVGVHRSYSAYVPTSDPKATLRGESYIVNLEDNSLEWYLPLNVSKGSDSKWDEPPRFPGLTNAYFQTLETAKDLITVPLSQ
ncbi:MAG: hypothetical protein V4582_25595 [Pseudomonadota bacterium]